MLKRSLQTLVAVHLVLIGLACSLIPLLLLWPHLDSGQQPSALLLWLGSANLIVLIAANMLLQRIWFFAGTGEPVPLEIVQERIMAVNELNCPVEARIGRRAIRLGWRIHEHPWCELLSSRDLRHLPELRCRFDAATRTVLLCDRIRTVHGLFCLEQPKVGWPRICLPRLRARQDMPGIIGDYATMAQDDYRLHPREIKSAVMGTILACGWNVRFSLF
ncbi:MAG: hypothetical protein ACOX5Z_00345 [Desulfobulbus sp.]|jgi:hypothetical protein